MLRGHPRLRTRPADDRLLRDRAGQRLHPPHARRAAARRRQRAQRGPDRRPGAAAEEPAQRPPPDPHATSRRGYELALVPGPETTPAQRAGFLAAYEQTMRRTGAAEHYFFGAAYFDRILEADRTWLALATAPDGDARRRLDRRRQRRLPPLLPQRQRRLAPARLADEERRRPPGRARRRAAACRSTSAAASPAATRLEEFKRGFANREQPWHTSEIVCDRGRLRSASAPAATPAASSPPTGRRAR